MFKIIVDKLFGKKYTYTDKYKLKEDYVYKIGHIIKCKYVNYNIMNKIKKKVFQSYLKLRNEIDEKNLKNIISSDYFSSDRKSKKSKKRSKSKSSRRWGSYKKSKKSKRRSYKKSKKSKRRSYRKSKKSKRRSYKKSKKSKRRSYRKSSGRRRSYKKSVKGSGGKRRKRY